MSYKINIIGAGNVATNIALALAQQKHQILMVASKGNSSAEFLAKRTASKAGTLSELPDEADICIIAVNDDQIPDVVKQMNPGSQLVVHTSGGVSLNLLNKFQRHGVFYPLQTLTTEDPVNFSNIPLCIEANNEDDISILKELACSISENVHLIDSESRAILHLAAVFANNFSNHMYTVAQKICESHQLSFDLLKPLIEETASKASQQQPARSQTGPALRNDKGTMEAHLKLLQNTPGFQKIYTLVSQSIAEKSTDGKGTE